MSKIKNFIVVEATYGEEKRSSGKIMAVKRHGLNLFPHVFKFNAQQMESYSGLGTFAVSMVGIQSEELGDGFDNLVVTLISGEDNTLIWSVDIDIKGDDLSYGVIDWKKEEDTFKYDNGAMIKA